MSIDSRPLPQTVRGADLTAFQQNILAIVAEEARYGLAIKRELERLYGEEINHGRLYPNIDTLVDEGYVVKTPLDQRTNECSITAEGREVLTDLVAYRAGALDLAVQSTRDGGGGDAR